jgi:hypothetical protein
MLRNALLFALLGLFAGAPLYAKPDPQSIVRDLQLDLNLEVEIQGRIGQYHQDMRSSLFAMVNSALKQARTVAPSGATTIYSADPSNTLFRNRSFRLVLTDVDRVMWGRQSVPLGGLNSGTLQGISGKESLSQHLILFLRVDQLMLQDGQVLQTYAYHRLFAALVKELFGTWPEHLGLALPELQLAQRKPGAAFELGVALSTCREFKRLLAHPALASGDFQGPLFNGYLQASVQVPEGSGLSFGPYAIAHAQSWSPEALHRLKGEKEEALNTWLRAQYLVFAVPQVDLNRTVFSIEASGEPVLKRKALLLNLVDTRDRITRSHLGLPSLLATDIQPFAPSETFVGALAVQNLDQIFSVVLWTDRIFYTADGRSNPDALALATVALASELYQGVQQYLFQPASALKPLSEVQLTELRIAALERAVSYVDSLRRSPLWQTLSSQEHESFDRVQAIYRQQVDATQCVLILLRKI